jgi:hypothetical protein
MKRSYFLSVLICIILAVPAYADVKTANRVTPLNKTTDFFATLGKSDNDSREILKERRDNRRIIRLKEEARRRNVETRKRMQDQQDDMMRKINAHY